MRTLPCQVLGFIPVIHLTQRLTDFSPNQFSQISRRLRQQLGSGIRGARNRWRLRYRNLDYVLFDVPASMPALPVTRGWLQARVLGDPPLSLWELGELFDQLAADPRIQGVVLRFSGVDMSLADLQTLRALISRLRQKGKRVVALAQVYDTLLYYVASAADAVLLQPNGDFAVTGLYSNVVFLKDALSTVGVQFDVVAISPFKSALDQLANSDVTPESRAQIDWLLDSRFNQIVSGIAEARESTLEAVRAMIDAAPMVDTAALEAGYVDALVYEEDLAEYLGAKHIEEYDNIEKRLVTTAPPATPNDDWIAVLRVAGLMTPGESDSLPIDLPLPVPIVGDERAGDVTVIRQLRAVQQDEDVKAVVVFIDSGGGAVTAAASMAAALEALAKTRPVIVYMNSVAASGGYWLATPARWIVAQPGTITGSIGVVLAKLVASELEEKFHVNSVAFERGANAGLFSTEMPFSEAQRAQMRASVTHSYGRFVERVAAARKMSPEAVDAIAGGRVWTGEQALANGLVDELGDLNAAIRKARTLANLPETTPAYVWQGKPKPLPPQLVEAVAPAAWITYVKGNAEQIASGQAQALLPFRIRG